MKNLFSIAILAATFAFSSCGNKPADAANTAATTTTSASTTATPAPAADNSLSGRITAAMCNCPAMKEMAAISKEIEANKNNQEKATELTGKIMELSPKMDECTKSFVAEVNAMSEEDKKKLEIEMQEKLTKTCPELAPKGR